MAVESVLCALLVVFAGSWCAWEVLGVLGPSFRQLLRQAADYMSGLTLISASFGGNSTKTRREEIAYDMPVFLDIVTLGLSAGLSFDASLELYCDRYQTHLSHMLSDAILSWRMGVRQRGEALRLVSKEAESPAFERFAAAVKDALAFGTPLASALERQAQVIRDEQRAEIEEEMERVPVRMLIPLGTLIVPAMLISILGPLLGPALSMG